MTYPGEQVTPHPSPAEPDSGVILRLLGEILTAARAQGLNQTTLARHAGVPRTSISRIKRTGRADLATLDKLGRVVGLRLGMLPDNDHAVKVARGELF